ncbi:hypothetical protein GCM10010182_61100 [Actinomadura cremea]|nr:hypothetical protein GCM10010182_61100 [Actinomadura cremea]
MAFLEPATWDGKVFTGAWTAGGAGAREVREPATGAVLGRVGLADAADVTAAASRAADAQRAWAAVAPAERAAILLRAAALLTEHATEIAAWLVRESGSVRLKAGIEIDGSAGECTQAAGLPTAPYGELLPAAGRNGLERRLPVGVVAVISPFNFPLLLSMRSVAPALALGNAVIVKPDPRTAVCGGAVIARLFEEAGLPAGVLQVLPGEADAGGALVEHPLVPVISFTGSTRAGRAIGARTGGLLNRSPTASRPGSCTSTTRPSTTTPRPPSAASAPPASGASAEPGPTSRPSPRPRGSRCAPNPPSIRSEREDPPCPHPPPNTTPRRSRGATPCWSTSRTASPGSR